MDYSKLAEMDMELISLTVIKLETLTKFFSKDMLNKLSFYGIEDLGTLIAFSRTPDYISSFEVKDAIELYGTVDVLKCRYLNVDPVIDMSDLDLPIEQLSTMMGFTYQTRLKLHSKGIKNVGDLFEAINGSRLPVSEFAEVYEKVRIVNKFYLASNPNSITYLNDQIDKAYKENEILDTLKENYKKRVA